MLVRRKVRLFLILLGVLPLAACSRSGGPTTGRVMDASTNKPLEGVMVIVRWKGRAFKLVDSETVCLHVETAVTDSDGNFQTNAWRQPAKILLMKDIAPEEMVYKRGYVEYYPRRQDKNGAMDNNVMYMTPFTGTREERMKDLMSMIGLECGPREDYVNKLIPIYRSLYEEAKSLAKTKEDKKIVKTLHYSVDILELGEAEANRKLDTREYDNE